MRSKKTMMELILNKAKEDPRIRLVGMEGSRTNPHVPKDIFQDYDISYIVTDMAPFLKDPSWTEFFGRRLLLQTPEDMELFSPELGGWYSYLMIFEDGNKLDLTLVPLEDVERYLAHDCLLEILLDKDEKAKNFPKARDTDYHVQPPTLGMYWDCQNEFWMVTTYVAKGLCRKEQLFAAYHHTHILQKELLRMIGWKVGVRTNFSLSLGKHYKYLEKHLSRLEWERLTSTFRLDTNYGLWQALFVSQRLMRENASLVGQHFGFPYPDFDKNIFPYIQKLYGEYGL